MPINPTEIYIGLMSGTSLDGVDIAIADFAGALPKLLFSTTYPYHNSIRSRIRDITLNPSASIDSLCQLDIELGKVYAEVVNHSLAKINLAHSQILAIGCHGQTIRHRPDAAFPYTLQSGDPNTVAAETGIATVADFRGKDVALGGEGAPLATAFHQFMFSSATTNRAIINIGGIANITYLPCQPGQTVLGFDTGPGNTLMDCWVQLHKNKAYDNYGQWAKSGLIINQLLDAMMEEPYFKRPPPKSTGTDYFNPDWLAAYRPDDYAPADIQATLLELTALSIADGISQLPAMPSECFVCGGGAHNLYLLARLQKALPESTISTTAQLKVDPDYIEALAFAWLAKQRINNLPGNIPSVTRASAQSVLGGIYSGYI